MPSRLQSRIDRLIRLEREQAGQPQPVKIVLVEGQHGIMDAMFLAPATTFANDEELIAKLVQSYHRHVAAGDEDDPHGTGPLETLQKILGPEQAAARVAQ